MMSLLFIFFCFFFFSFFFFNDPATTEIYTLSLHDALPISVKVTTSPWVGRKSWPRVTKILIPPGHDFRRSEEHTSELQSLRHLVCRLLLEKKKKKKKIKKNNTIKNKHNHNVNTNIPI